MYESEESQVTCRWQKRFEKDGRYLITLSIGTDFAHKSGGHFAAAYPQNHAVVDDFGTLVCVEAWR